MGTQQSSSGPGPGVPLVPPWADAPVRPPDGALGAPLPGSPDRPPPPPAPPTPTPALPLPRPGNGPAPTPTDLAPAGRFGPARTSLGRFARSGRGDDLRRAVGHYVNKGLGGSRSAARRLARTARTAERLYAAFQTLSGEHAAGPDNLLDPVLLRGRSVEEVMDAVVEAVRPTDGTLDSEASRDAIARATSELLEREPMADPFDLTQAQREFTIERFVANEIFNQIMLDIGKAIQLKAPNVPTGVRRIQEVRDYVREIVSSAFKKQRDAGRAMTAASIAAVAHDAIQDTMAVFESYAT